jgi:hypothetical protein
MMRQEPRLVLRTVKSRAKANAFRYSPYAFEAMVDEGIYEEDVKRAFSTARLLEIRGERRRGTHYILQGYDMDEGELVLVCQLLRQSIEVVDLYRA